MFLHELALTDAAIVVLAIAGGFILLPFRRTLPFVLLAAPLAGLICVVLGTALLYGFMGLSVRASGGIALAVCATMTLAGIVILRPRVNRRQLLWMLAAALIVMSAVTFGAEATTIRLGQPAVLYMDGTDHLGYAQLGDWLTAHTVDKPPVFTPANPYQAFPERLFHTDPRFGSFFTLALVGVVRRLPCTFAYDSACAIVLAAGVLAVAGTFARRSLPALFLILAGLLTSHWYDYSRGGYFGKLLGYPAALLITGLFLSVEEDQWQPATIATLAVLTAGATLMHSAMTTGVFLVTLLSCAIACRRLIVRPPEHCARLRVNFGSLVTLALLIVVAVVSSGIPARPVPIGFPDWHLTWSYVLPRILDVENQGVRLTGYGPNGLAWLTVLGLGLWAALVLVAVRLRNADAAGLLIGPALLLLGLAAAHQRAAAFQMIGTFYPFMICAAGIMTMALEPPRPGPVPPPHRVLRWAALALVVLAIGLRLPRGYGALQRYAGVTVPARLQYTRAEADCLAKKIGGDSVDVDLDEPNPTEFVLVELGRRGLALRWGPKAWDIVAGYTGQPAPQYVGSARYRLVDRSKVPVPTLPVVAQTPQYFLLDRRP
jgi:hypothetical protein